MSENNKTNWWQKLNQEWVPELIGILFFLSRLLITFYLLEATPNLETNIFFILSQPFGIIIILVVIYFLLKALRYHLLRSAIREPSCPDCNHQLKLRPRKSYQRKLSYLIPLRRYYCRNCGWEGMRVYKQKTYSFNQKQVPNEKNKNYFNF